MTIDTTFAVSRKWVKRVLTDRRQDLSIGPEV